MRLSPSLGLIAATHAAPRQLALDSKSIEKWQKTARDQLAELTGYSTGSGAPKIISSKGPIALPRVRGQKPAQPILRTTYYLRVRPESDLVINLITSRDMSGTLPVILYMAGSTSGVHLGWGEAKVPIDHQRLSIGADLARQAIRRGCLAVCIEQIGFGERLERDLPKRSAHRTIDAATHATLIGQTLQGLKSMDVSAVVNWLMSNQAPVSVQRDRIYLFGHSSGGTTALYAAALDPRIQGVLASGSVRRVSEIIASRGESSGEYLIPRFLNYFEADDVIALVAPRPFVALSGVNDHIFPYDGVLRAVNGARPAFTALCADHKLAAVAAPNGHQYYPSECWAAWRRYIDPLCGDDPDFDAK